MKKSLLALAVLGTVAGTAAAQSSVTLFGNIDVNVRHIKHGDESRWTLSNNGYSSSAFGVRGVEDLGGGLKAGFHLEGAIFVDEGIGGASGGGLDWKRRATVSLMGNWGEIRLGRDYVPTFWTHTQFDLFGTNGVGGQTNIQGVAGSGATTLVRANNTVAYHLPSNLGGVYGQLTGAFGEGVNGNKYAGGRIGWKGGPVNVALAYGRTFDTSPAPGVVPEDDLTAWNVGASYDIGFMTILAQYHTYKWDENTQKNWYVGASVPVGPGLIKVTYGKASDFTDANQIAVGYLHALSKRTFLYAHFARIDNDDNAAYRVPAQTQLAVAGGGLKSTGYEFGVRHTF